MPWHAIPKNPLSELLHFDNVDLLGENAIDYASQEDQSAKLMAIGQFMQERTGGSGSGFLAGGVYVGEEVRWPGTDICPIVGAGKERSFIRLLQDLGPGKAALRLPGSEYDLRDFAVLGPTDLGNVHDGRLPTQCWGIYTKGRGIMSNIRSQYCAAGIALINDHQEFRSCDFGRNGYALELVDNAAGGLGDQLWQRCQMTSGLRSSIAICDTSSFTHARVLQGHFGAPITFWRYPAGTMSADGDVGSAVLTGVATPSWFPVEDIVGLQVAGSNIPAGTTVLDCTGSGWNRTVTLSAEPTGVVTHIYFPLHQYRCVGSVAQGPTLTNVEIPDWVSVDSITFGVGIEGPNIPAGTTVNSISGSAGNYTLGLSATPTGDVIAMTFSPRANPLQGVYLGTQSIEYSGNAMVYDEGRARGTWTRLTFDGPTEYGTGDGNKWPGKPDPAAGVDDEMANITVGDMYGWHWRGHAPPISSNLNQPYIIADSIQQVRLDECPSSSRLGRLRTSGEGNPSTAGIVDVQAGKRGVAGCGIKHQQYSIARENITDGALLETWSGGVRESRNGASSLICGVAANAYSTGAIVKCLTQSEGTNTRVKNHASGSTIPLNALIKPDPANQGCVKEATSLTDGPILGRVNDAAITPGTLGRVQLRIP
jgi:hypothetical protein